VRHFFGRFFDNKIVSQTGDMHANLMQAVGLMQPLAFSYRFV
jgi:hypothetical protein